jgi:hypothetical protein
MKTETIQDRSTPRAVRLRGTPGRKKEDNNMARGKILTLTIALGIASVLALIIGLASTEGILPKVRAGGGLSERSRPHGCSVDTLEGNYLFTASVLSRSDRPDPTYPRVAAGVRTFDGAGNLSQLATNSFGGAISHDVDVTGTYTLDSNCTGTMTIAGTRHWDIFVAEDGREGVGVTTTEGLIGSQTFKKP